MSFYLFEHNISVSLTNAAGGSVRRHTWRCKCLNLSRSLNQMFAQEAQTVRLLLTRLRDVKNGAFQDFQRGKKRSTHTRTCLRRRKKKKKIEKFICLTNQGYPERQRITRPISVEGGIAPRMTKKSTLIGCGVIWMTRSRGDGRGVLIKSRWRYDPNSACPVISPLTKNHYIRCQRGSIFWQGEVPSFPAPSLRTCASTANLEQQEGWGQRFVQISTSIPAAKTGGITLRLLRQTVPARHH